MLIIGIFSSLVVAFVAILYFIKRHQKEHTPTNDASNEETDLAFIQLDGIEDNEESKPEDESQVSIDVPDIDDDKKQNLLDFLAVMQTLGSFKNRYSALQNAAYVANLIIDEYNSSGSKDSFYDYVISFCEKMRFQGKDDAFGLAEEVINSLNSGNSIDNTTQKIVNRQSRKESTKRPDPEQIYPINKTGDKDIDDFVSLCKTVIHSKVHHLKASEDDCINEVKRVVRLYKPREGRSCYDFFSKAFQFGYLKEKRFQDLYYIIQKIAEAKKTGCSNEETAQRINAIYKSDRAPQCNRTPKESVHIITSNVEEKGCVPFYAYTDIQHKIISTATRISRRFYDNKLFKKTGDIAIDLINKYHNASGDVMSEKAFYTFSLSSLQKEDKKNAAVYAALIETIELLFMGLSEDRVLKRLSSEKKIPVSLYQIQVEQNASINQTRPIKKQIVKSSCLTGRNSLIRILVKCEMPSDVTKLCINLVNQLDSTINHRIKLSENDYFNAVQKAIESKKTHDQNSQILSTILASKMSFKQDLEILRLIRSRFPSLYKIEKPKKRIVKTKSKRFR